MHVIRLRSSGLETTLVDATPDALTGALNESRDSCAWLGRETPSIIDVDGSTYFDVAN